MAEHSSDVCTCGHPDYRKLLEELAEWCDGQALFWERAAKSHPERAVASGEIRAFGRSSAYREAAQRIREALEVKP